MNQCSQAGCQIELTRKRFNALIDSINDGLVDIRADNSMAASGVLHRQRQADFPKPDDRDGHGVRHGATARPVAELRSTASAIRVTATPCAIVTMSAGFPRTASRNASCSRRSGSGFGIA